MPTVLVVDDEPSVRRAVSRVLAGGGMTVVESGSATEALAVIGAEKIDAVVCDVLMPEISGLAFYDALVQQAPQLRHRVVFLTGLAHEPSVHDPIEQRGVPLVSKLDDLRLVGDAVRVALLKPIPASPG